MNYSFVPLVLDIGMAVVVVITIIAFLRKGFLAGIVSLVGKIASLVAAWLVASRLAPSIFENFFRTGMTDKTAQTIQSNGMSGVESVLNSLSGIVPESLRDSLLQSVSGTLDTSSSGVAQTIVQQVIMPLMVPVISIIIFFITYAICRLLISFLVAALTHINRVPLVGTANRVCGGVLGLLAGVLNVFIIMVAVWAVLIITGDSLPFFNQSVLNGSWCYTMFTNYSPFFTAV